jgi:hypothetical protein
LDPQVNKQASTWVPPPTRRNIAQPWPRPRPVSLTCSADAWAVPSSPFRAPSRRGLSRSRFPGIRGPTTQLRSSRRPELCQSDPDPDLDGTRVTYPLAKRVRLEKGYGSATDMDTFTLAAAQVLYWYSGT